MHYIVHYTVLFHNKWGYYNSLIMQALELLPGRAECALAIVFAPPFCYWQLLSPHVYHCDHQERIHWAGIPLTNHLINKAVWNLWLYSISYLVYGIFYYIGWILSMPFFNNAFHRKSLDLRWTSKFGPWPVLCSDAKLQFAILRRQLSQLSI